MEHYRYHYKQTATEQSPIAGYRIKLTTRVGLLSSIALFGRNNNIDILADDYSKRT
jgi:hypothetical protein